MSGDEPGGFSLPGVPPEDPEGLMTLLCCASALASLNEAGVLALIVDQVRAPADLARRLDLDVQALSRQLDLLAAMGLLQVHAEGARFRPELVALTARGPAPLPAALGLLRGLPLHLRTGAALVRDTRQRGSLYRAVTPSLARVQAEAAQALARRLPAVGSVLDVGAGAGGWSLAMAHAHPGTRVTALDLEPVLPVFERHAQGLSPPAELVAGDFRSVQLDRRFERVLLANVLHLEPEPAARSLFARGRAWMEAGGQLVVLDALFDNEASRLGRAAYALHLGLRVQGGRVYAEQELEAWARGLGLRLAERIELDERRGFGALVFEEAP